MRCVHCGREASIKVTEGNGQEYGLCGDCDVRDEVARTLDMQRTASTLNFLLGEFDHATGYIAGPTPRMHVPSLPPISLGAVNVGNVSVHNSSVGVINTGTIQSIASAVGTMRQAGNDAVADAVAAMIDAINNSDELRPQAANDAAELLSVVAEEAIKPAESRRLGAVNSVLLNVSAYIDGAAGLSQLWQQHATTIAAFFGL
jgi:hypothetical protein